MPILRTAWSTRRLPVRWLSLSLFPYPRFSSTSARLCTPTHSSFNVYCLPGARLCPPRHSPRAGRLSRARVHLSAPKRDHGGVVLRVSHPWNAPCFIIRNSARRADASKRRCFSPSEKNPGHYPVVSTDFSFPLLSLSSVSFLWFRRSISIDRLGGQSVLERIIELSGVKVVSCREKLECKSEWPSLWYRVGQMFLPTYFFFFFF